MHLHLHVPTQFYGVFIVTCYTGYSVFGNSAHTNTIVRSTKRAEQHLTTESLLEYSGVSIKRRLLSY